MNRKAKIYKISDIALIAAALKDGAAAVLPTDTVYGLITCATAPGALDLLNKIKNNPADKPPQVLCSLEQAFNLAKIDDNFRRAAAIWPQPLTIVARTSPAGAKLMRGAATIGLRATADKFLLDIIAMAAAPFFASSANMHGAPVCESERQVLDTFADKVDIIVLGGDIKARSSAVVDVSGPGIKIIRDGVAAKKLAGCG